MSDGCDSSRARGLRGRGLGLLLALAGLSCTPHDSGARVEFFEIDGLSFSWRERYLIRNILEDAAAEVRDHLPGLPSLIVFRVQPGTPSEVNEHSGETATALPPNLIVWSVDLERAGGALSIARKHLRAGVFHYLHHLARDSALSRTSLLDRAVGEGLATQFERDFAGATRPWSHYPDHAAVWVDELRNVPDEEAETWQERQPAERRWIAYKAGTYLADCASRASGRTAAQLATIPTEEILAMAERGD